MGAVKKVIRAVSPLANIIGFGEDKPKTSTPAVAKPAQSDTTKSASEIADENEKKRKAALIAANAGGSAPASQGLGGEDANVTRKTLLGL